MTWASLSTSRIVAANTSASVAEPLQRYCRVPRRAEARAYGLRQPLGAAAHQVFFLTISDPYIQAWKLGMTDANVLSPRVTPMCWQLPREP
jgi:hypothetical protein